MRANIREEVARLLSQAVTDDAGGREGLKWRLAAQPQIVIDQSRHHAPGRLWRALAIVMAVLLLFLVFTVGFLWGLLH